MRARERAVVLLAAVAAALACHASPALALSFGTAPHLPALPTLVLNGQAQTDSGQMNNLSVSTGVLELSGWNVTVQGDATSGHSAVFKVYCPGPSACGPDPVGYLAGGSSLAANSLVLNSTGATFSPSGVSMLCGSGCNIDSATPVKIASDTNLAALTTWTSSGWSSTSVTLSVPTTLRKPLQAGEVYHLDVVWTLISGP
jgi:hypothetical protein